MPDRHLSWELTLDDRDNFISAGQLGRQSAKSFTRDVRSTLSEWPACIPTPHHSRIGFTLTVGYGDTPNPHGLKRIDTIVGECSGELRDMRAQVEMLFSMIDSCIGGTP